MVARRKKKVSFKRGTTARKARGKVAEQLKKRRKVKAPFAVATKIVKRAKPKARKRLARRGLTKPRRR